MSAEWDGTRGEWDGRWVRWAWAWWDEWGEMSEVIWACWDERVEVSEVSWAEHGEMSEVSMMRWAWWPLCAPEIPGLGRMGRYLRFVEQSRKLMSKYLPSLFSTEPKPSLLSHLTANMTCQYHHKPVTRCACAWRFNSTTCSAWRRCTRLRSPARTTFKLNFIILSLIRG